MASLVYKSTAAKYLRQVLIERDLVAGAMHKRPEERASLFSELRPRSGFSKTDILFDETMRSLSGDTLAVILPRLESVRASHSALLENLCSGETIIQGWEEHLETTSALIDVLGIAETSPANEEQSISNSTHEAERELRQFNAAADTETHRIVAIAKRKDWDAGKRLRAIADIDHRYKGKKSVVLGELLGISDAAIRQTAVWKEWKAAEKDLD